LGRFPSSRQHSWPRLFHQRRGRCFRRGHLNLWGIEVRRIFRWKQRPENAVINFRYGGLRFGGRRNLIGNLAGRNLMQSRIRVSTLFRSLMHGQTLSVNWGEGIRKRTLDLGANNPTKQCNLRKETSIDKAVTNLSLTASFKENLTRNGFPFLKVTRLYPSIGNCQTRFGPYRNYFFRPLDLTL